MVIVMTFCGDYLSVVCDITGFVCWQVHIMYSVSMCLFRARACVCAVLISKCD